MSVSTTSTATNTRSHANDERILVVKRDFLFTEPAWHGVKKVDFTEYLDCIQQRKEFLWRSTMEEDPTYKQIIPYLVFTHNDKYFLMQRTATASEQRLQNKFSLGIGGHIREEDLIRPIVATPLRQGYAGREAMPGKQEDVTDNDLFNWARREFHEEVTYDSKLIIEPLGILNDDTNAVGKVHLGFVLLLKGDTSDISVKSELKSGRLVSLDECKQNYDALESWSQLVIDFL